MKNVLKKIQAVKKALSEMKISASGINKHSNYTYYELSDFIPQLVKEMEKVGLCDVFNIKYILGADNIVREFGVLEVYDVETEEKVEFLMPTVEVEAKVISNKIQALGAKNTYIKRYLYMNAFNIVENDQIDAPPMMATAKQVEVIKGIFKDNPQKLKDMLDRKGYQSVEEFTKVEADTLLNAIKQSATKKEA